MAKYTGNGRAGARIDIVGLEGLAKTLGLTTADLGHAVQDALRGDAGEELAANMRSRTPIGKGSFGGHVREDIKIHDLGLRGGVLVGYQGGLSGGNKGGGRLQKGAWLESGTKPHDIEVKRDVQKSKGMGSSSFTSAKALWFNGVARETVHHPGSRALKIAEKSMKSSKQEMMNTIVDHINIMAESAGWQGGYTAL